MPVIKLRAEDPIVLRASALDTRSLIEVGFIPEDEFGCKIYANNYDGVVHLFGIHSRTYGCQREQQTDIVEVSPPAKVKRCLA